MDHSYQVWSKSSQQFRRCPLKQLLMTDDTRAPRTSNHHNSLPWANGMLMKSWILRVSCKVNVASLTLQDTQSIHDSMNLGFHVNFARDPKYSWFHEHSKNWIHFLNESLVYKGLNACHVLVLNIVQSSIINQLGLMIINRGYGVWNPVFDLLHTGMG